MDLNEANPRRAFDTNFDGPPAIDPRHDMPSDLAILGSTLRRSWLLIVLLAAAGLGLGLLVASFLPKTYFAEAVLLVQPQRNPLDPNAPVPPATPEVVRSQLEVIRSRRIIDRVIDRLNLNADAEFSGSSTVANRAELVGEAVAERLSLDNDGRSLAIKIGFKARTPVKASRIADVFAAEYMAEQQEQKIRTSVASRAGLDQRLGRLRAEVFMAERNAEAFRRANKLVILAAYSDTGEDATSMSPAAREMSELARQQALLVAQRAQAEARASSATADLVHSGGRASPDVLASPIIATLLSQDADLARREAELAERYKPGYPGLDEVRQQRRTLTAAIDREVHDIEASVRSQARAARLAENQAQVTASRLRGQLDREISASVRYRELLNEAKVGRANYQEFAQQVGRLSQRAGIQLPDTVLVSGAPIPLKPISPKPLLLGVGGLLTGLFLGVCTVLLRRRPSAAISR